MVRKGFKPEQIIGKLREVEVMLSQGSTVGEASRKIGVTEQTYCRWRKEYGGMLECSCDLRWGTPVSEGTMVQAKPQ
jgi:hypothetical protein